MIELRKATNEDMDILYQWANDPVVRNNSFNSEVISYEGHVRWFHRIMNDDSNLQFILMDNDVPVGQIRLTVHGDEAEIGYSVAPECRGRGYGRKILELVVDQVQTSYPGIKRLVAKVKPNNDASNSLFARLGYDMDYYCYSLNVNKE